MKVERQIQIFEIMIDKKELFKTCLCNYLSVLTILNFVSLEEYKETLLEMKYGRKETNSFWWEIGKWEPREEFLRGKVEKLRGQK
jgi:hypothetical protein